MNPDRKITGVVLAGGRGRRMGERDKGLLELRGKPLAQWAIERLRPQVDELLISANQHAETYGAMGGRVVADALTGFAGPLAGLHAALVAAQTPWVVSVPCDTPLLPLDLVGRLCDAVHLHQATVAVASDGVRRHPVFCLCRRELHASLADYLARGERRMEDWLATAGAVEADFSDQAAAFCNINTPADLSALETAQLK